MLQSYHCTSQAAGHLAGAHAVLPRSPHHSHVSLCLPSGHEESVLREDRRLVRGRVDGPLSEWALVSVASESEGVSVVMTDGGYTLFRAECDGATERVAGGHSPRVEGCESGREEDPTQWSISNTSKSHTGPACFRFSRWRQLLSQTPSSRRRTRPQAKKTRD